MKERWRQRRQPHRPCLLYLDQDRLKIRRVTLEDNDDGARLTAAIAGQLQALQDAPFDRQQHIRIADDAWLALDVRQLNLQLVVKESALGTVLRARSSDIARPAWMP